MNFRVRDVIPCACVWLAVLLLSASSLWAQESAETDSTVTDTTFAKYHLRLDLDGLQPPWLGRQYENQRINWSLDSTNILFNSLQDEWQSHIDGRAKGVFMYQILAGDTTGIPIAFDFDTYRLIKT